MRGPTASGLDPVPYLRAAGLDPDDPRVVVDERGNRSLVLVDASRGLVWRFPRWPEDLALLPTAARRLAAAGALDLPAPRLLDAVLEAPLGVAHLVTSYVPGLAMDDPAVAALAPALLRRLGEELAELLVRLAAVPWDRWPPTDRPGRSCGPTPPRASAGTCSRGSTPRRRPPPRRRWRPRRPRRPPRAAVSSTATSAA